MKATNKLFKCCFALVIIFSWLALSPATSASHPPVESTNPQALRTKPVSWLTGVWEGTAYQSNTKENWTLKLTAKNNSFRIDYPSLSCGGTWQLLSVNKTTATFREKLTYGQDQCVDNVTVTIQRLNRKQVAYWYVEPNDTRVIGIAVLEKQ